MYILNRREDEENAEKPTITYQEHLDNNQYTELEIPAMTREQQEGVVKIISKHYYLRNLSERKMYHHIGTVAPKGEHNNQTGDLHSTPIGDTGEAVNNEIKTIDEPQNIADLVISINSCYKSTTDHKRHINYLLSLSEDREEYEIDRENFQFQSLGVEYLQECLKTLETENKKVEEERMEISSRVDDDDYK